ncbi:hypothetical protein CFRA_11105 [Corynebacterium frankenforstense DSM 45800]|uniref:Uncharacterized protein n=2 Tax=Corynebacterium TaxID=1716 RepID=A0A1L7CV15_9CORY|nr:hypothetical protein CFRA_11105 [Corynebacterium frankenforstense DSM 45800]
MLDEFMALDSRNKRAKWIKKHTDFDLVKEFSDATDDDTNQVSLGNFAEIEAEAYADAVNENGTPRVRADYFLSEGDFSAKDAATMRQSFGSDITDAYMVDFRNSGGVIFVKSGGSWHFLIYYPE